MRAITERWQQSEWFRPTLAEINIGETARYYYNHLVDGHPYLTRHKPPVDASNRDRLFADDDQSDIAGAFRRFILTCFHEAGHGVCYALGGATVAYAAVRAMGHASDGEQKTREWAGYVNCASAGVTIGDRLISTTAGERAANLALRKFGLWTPARAWGIEIGARFDRSLAATTIDQMGYTLTDLHVAADRALGRNWQQVVAVAGTLARRAVDSGEWGYVNGEEIKNPSAHMQAEAGRLFSDLHRLELLISPC